MKFHGIKSISLTTNTININLYNQTGRKHLVKSITIIKTALNLWVMGKIEH